jgi:hypothetical protein
MFKTLQKKSSAPHVAVYSKASPRKSVKNTNSLESYRQAALSHPHGGILQLSINMSTQPNVPKRGRSVDQRSTYTYEKRFLTSGVEVEIEDPR